MEWLTNDIAAITYLTVDESIQQFIATYGDRGGGLHIIMLLLKFKERGVAVRQR